MPRCLSFSSQLRSPPDISRSEWACPNWQNNMETNWLHELKPLAWRSDSVSLTIRWNSKRGNSCNSWLNMLQFVFVVESSSV